MSWPMPNPSSWNVGIAPTFPPQMTPTDMNIGSYTPEQWAVMQQQNWQQWAQWQQQYAQWQTQYGDKYSEQMSSMQAVRGMPPLPPANSAPPPAPPPPDNPPPPPPHENNQPLYGAPPTVPEPVPAPINQQNPNQGSYNSNKPGNNQNWSHSQNLRVNELSDNQSNQSVTAVNAEALKKLAEEERLFDIQFQKWEEEIDKWKKENVNHPDKQAYKEYEQKFEGCRAQLLERRQQMKQKRARLLNNNLTVANTPVTSNISTSAPPPLLSTTADPKQSQNYNINKPAQNYQPNAVPPQLLNTNHYNPKQNEDYNINKPPPNYQQNLVVPPLLEKSNYNPKQSYNINKPPPSYQQKTQYQDYSNSPQYQQSEQGYDRSNNSNFDPQDRYESYQDMNDDYSTASSTNFLPTTASSKNIPGLDLVPEDKGSTKVHEVIDITEETVINSQAPDYTTISKGINSILGDEKIMNILSMVRAESAPAKKNTDQYLSDAVVSGQHGGDNNYGNNLNNTWNRNQNFYNQQATLRQNIAPPCTQSSEHQNLQQDPNTRYPQMQQKNQTFNQRQNMLYDNRQDNMYNERENNMSNQSSYYDNKDDNAQQNMPPRHGQNAARSNLPPMRPQQPIRPLLQNRPMQYNLHEESNIDHSRDMYENPVQVHKTEIPSRPLIEPVKPKWIEEPMFTPSIIVEYEHKPLRVKARDFIEPVHIFEYDHKSKDDEYRKKDFEKEADEMFTRKSRRSEMLEDRLGTDRFAREQRDYEMRSSRVDNMRGPPREYYFERRRSVDRQLDDRRRDDRDKYSRREDIYRDRERDWDRDAYRDRYRDSRRDDRDSRRDDRDSRRDDRDSRRDDSVRRRSNSRDRDSRKRAHSRESERSNNSLTKRTKDMDSPGSNKHKLFEKPLQHVVMIDDLLEPPGRHMRPEKIVIILRGPPGSGKSYLAKLIRDKEAEHGGTARIMSIDDYFMQEGEIEEKDPATGKIVKKPTLKYEYDQQSEESYLNSLKRAFKRSITDGYFTFLIYDAVNDQLKSYADVWNFARQQGFQVYICTMDFDVQTCHKRNIHNRSLDDIEMICSNFFATPAHHIHLDATTLLQSASITDVHMEDVDDDVIIEESKENEVESVFTSKWETMDDVVQLARLDGISKPLRRSQFSMEDFLQIDDWKPTPDKQGKKTVRWADIEEEREREKMRALGFVVGQTDWKRMMDPTMGKNALTQTKYIERVNKLQ